MEARQPGTRKAKLMFVCVQYICIGVCVCVCAFSPYPTKVKEITHIHTYIHTYIHTNHINMLISWRVDIKGDFLFTTVVTHAKVSDDYVYTHTHIVILRDMLNPWETMSFLNSAHNTKLKRILLYVWVNDDDDDDDDEPDERILFFFLSLSLSHINKPSLVNRKWLTLGSHKIMKKKRMVFIIVIWLNTGKLTRSRHREDWQIESSFLILWLVVHGRS